MKDTERRNPTLAKTTTRPKDKEGLLVCVSGPSGVGKGTVIAKVRERMPFVHHSVSVTTRPKRPDEVEGVSYFFRTEKEFKEMIERDEILEYDIYLGNYYGTPLPPLLERIERGQDVLFDLTVPGSISLMNHFKTAVTIFLLPPTVDHLRARLEARGTESREIMDRRIHQASLEIPQAALFEYVIINEDVDRAAGQILTIIEAEKLRYIRQLDVEKDILLK